MLQLALHYVLFLVPSEKLVVQDLGKGSCEKNIPKQLYSVLRQRIVGIVRPLTLLPAVSYCGMNFRFEAGWLFVPIKSSVVIRTRCSGKQKDTFWCMFKTKAENTTKIQHA